MNLIHTNTHRLYVYLFFYFYFFCPFSLCSLNLNCLLFLEIHIGNGQIDCLKFVLISPIMFLIILMKTKKIKSRFDTQIERTHAKNHKTTQKTYVKKIG